jgi:hypothetical protein
VRAALAILVAYVAACLAVVPLVDTVDGLLRGDAGVVADALSVGRLAAVLSGVWFVMLICLPAFSLLRLGLFLARLRGIGSFAVAGALSAVASFFVLTLPYAEWPTLHGLTVLAVSGLAAGGIYWAMEYAVLGVGRTAAGAGGQGTDEWTQ